jgi:hypothetical protein
MNQKYMAMKFFLGCWMQKSVSEYLVPFSNGSAKLAGSPEKRTLAFLF